MSNTSINVGHPVKTGAQAKLPPFPVGLLAGALAAKEMGDLLAVHSDSPGLGSRCTLELSASADHGWGFRCFKA